MPQTRHSRHRLPPSARVALWLRQLTRSGRLEKNWLIVAIAALIGTVTAHGAMLFAWMVHQGEALLNTLTADTSPVPLWLALALPIAGALVCGVIVHFGAPEARGHGVPEVLTALLTRKGLIRPRVAICKILASAFTIGSGGSAGAEGPIVQIGSTIGSSAGRALRTGPDQTSMLLGCGAAAGIASIFNAPIAGVFFVVEILLRDLSARTFVPIVIASVFSTAVTQAYYGQNEAIFSVSNLIAHDFRLFELPYFMVLGIVAAVVSVAFIASLDWMETNLDRLRVHDVLKPVVGATALWLMSLAVVATVGDLHPTAAHPAYYGNGYGFIEQCLTPDFYTTDASTQLLLILAGLVALKMVATLLTLGTGGSGGVFAPSLFLGATTGGAFGLLLHHSSLPGAGDVSPAAFALVGMAAMVAGTTHAPLTAILMLFEITGNYRVILPIMIAAVMATTLAQALHRVSIYTSRLRRRGLQLGVSRDVSVLRTIAVHQIPLQPATFVHPEEPASRLIEVAAREAVEEFVVVDKDDRFLGLIRDEDLRTALIENEAMPLLVVGELLRETPPTTYLSEKLDTVMDKFSGYGGSCLAVTASRDSRRVVGLLTRGAMMKHYHQVMARET